MPTIDASFPKTGHGASGSSVAASGVTTSGASVIVAVVCVDNPGGAISVSGGGLSWSKKVGQSLTGSGNGWVEIWAAQSAAALSSQTITASFTSCNGCDIAVYSVSGANASPFGNTGSFQNNTSNTNPSQCAVNAQASGSLIIGGFCNFAGASAPTALATTTLDYTATSIDSICAGHATTTGVGNVTVGVSAPGANFSIAAALELLAPVQPKQWIRRQPMRNGPPLGDPVSRFRLPPNFPPTPASTAPVPTLVQHVSSTSNKSGNTSVGRVYNFQLPNDVGAGNCLVLWMAAKWSAGRTIAITDNNGNTWTGSPAVTANDGVGSILYGFVLPNANAGATKVTATFDATAFLPFQYHLQEWCNVATASPVDGTSSTTSTSAPAVTVPTFTPTTNNDVHGGHLVLSYWWNAGGYNGSSHPCSLYVPGQNSQLLAGETVWGATDNGTFQGAQAEVKPIIGPVSPTMTITQTTNDTWLGVAIALKAASAGTPAPTTGIRIRSIHHRTNETPSSSTIKVQFPCSGNLLVMCTANWDSLMPITSMTDNKGNTWTKRNTNSGCPQYWDGYNASTGLAVTGNDLVVTITTGAGGSGVSMLFYDIGGAAAFPFDTTSFAGSTTDTGGANVTDQPAFTPTSAPGLSMACVAFGTGPSSGLNTGSPAGAVFDLVYYTGEVDADTMDNADGQAHVYHSTTAAQHWNWVVANGSTTTSVQATAVSYKGATVTQNYTQSVDGTLTSSGALVNRTNKNGLAGTLTSSGGLQKTTNKPAAGTLTSAGALVKRTAKGLAGTLTSSGALQGTKVALLSLAGTLTSSGALTKQTGKPVAGTLTSAGAVSKQTGKGLAGSLASSGTVTKRTAKSLAGSLTPAGALVTVKAALLALSGTLTSSGALTKQARPSPGGALSSSGVLSRRTATSLAGVLSATGAVAKRTARALSGALAFIGDLLGASGGVAPPVPRIAPRVLSFASPRRRLLSASSDHPRVISSATARAALKSQE